MPSQKAKPLHFLGSVGFVPACAIHLMNTAGCTIPQPRVSSHFSPPLGAFDFYVNLEALFGERKIMGPETDLRVHTPEGSWRENSSVPFRSAMLTFSST